MGRDSFIHPTLKRPRRRGSEMSTWRGRLLEISILFPSPKRKENTPPPPLTPLPQHSPRPAPIDARRQVEERGREDALSPSFILYPRSCWLLGFCWQCICFTAIQIMLTQGPSLALARQNNCGKETRAKIKKQSAGVGKWALIKKMVRNKHHKTLVTWQTCLRSLMKPKTIRIIFC